MVGEGLVSSLARPNGNTTGVSILATELDGKRQEILIEAVPGLRRMAALADPNNGNGDEKPCSARGCARTRRRAFNSSGRQGRGNRGSHRHGAGFGCRGGERFGITDVLDVHRQFIMERVATLRLPAMYQWPDMADEGGFVAYGPRLTLIPELYCPTGRKALQRRQSRRPSVEQPTKFELVINLKQPRHSM